MRITRISNDEFHQSAVRGLRAMHARGDLSDGEMAEQERWWASGGHMDGAGETVTFTVDPT